MKQLSAKEAFVPAFMLAFVLASRLFVPPRAEAYTITSGFTESCHERMALAAIGLLLKGRDLGNVTVPSGDLWRRVAATLAPAVLAHSDPAAVGAELTDAQKFVLFSATVGIRAPDTGGHSVSNLADLRRAQIDPSPDSQHLHCLRAPSEDGLAGDRSVLAGSEVIIRQAVTEAAMVTTSGQGRNTTAPLYLDFYGQVEVEVDHAAYSIGRALHTLQDCHAHTLRSVDGAIVFSVLNYMDAVAGDLVEARDGLAHADSLDDCHRQDIRPLVERATATSNALAAAGLAMAAGDPAPLDRGFAACPPGTSETSTCGWLLYQPACAASGDESGCCSPDNAYCSSPYLAIAREGATEPYLQAVLSCAASGRVPASRGSSLVVLVGVVLVTWTFSRRGRIRRPARATRVLLGIFLGPFLARSAAAQSPAEEGRTLFATFEGHLSLLSDAPGRSFIDVTTGLGLRGGFRQGRWGLVVQIERNLWLPTELSRDLQPGALNFGMGGEALFWREHLRVGITAGPSLLWFDTALDDKGTVGAFVDLRPMGLRWTLNRFFALAFDPLSLAIVAPVLHDPGIRQVEYRTLFGLEGESR